MTHVEGDVDPIRDMEIIQTELRLKDIEWVEKQLDGLKKTTRSLGNSSLADRARKEEIVSPFPSHPSLLVSHSNSTLSGDDREGPEMFDGRPEGREKRRLEQ